MASMSWAIALEMRKRIAKPTTTPITTAKVTTLTENIPEAIRLTLRNSW